MNDKEDSEGPTTEYGTVCEAIKHVQNIYFAHLTVFVTVTAGFVAIAVSDFKLTPINAQIIYSFAFTYTLVSLYNTKIYLTRSFMLQDRAVELEKMLGFDTYQTLRNGFPWFYSMGAASWYFLYWIIAGIWFLSTISMIEF